VLGLEERLEHAGRLVDAQVVEDHEVEDQERQQAPGQAEQQPGGMPGRLVGAEGCEGWHAWNITLLLARA